MDPRVSRRESKLHLTYDLPHRIHCSAIYPIAAPNGSTLILYGHDRGLRVLWRGGRRLKAQPAQRPPRQTNGTSRSQDVIVIDDSDDDAPQPSTYSVEYESEADEQDAECPYPDIVQGVDIALNAEVLRIAVPSSITPTLAQTSYLAQKHAILVLSCSTGKLSLLLIPLVPPQTADKEDFVNKHIRELELDNHEIPPHDICIKIHKSTELHVPASQNLGDDAADSSAARLLIAAAAKRVHVWTVNLTHHSISISTKLPCRDLRSPTSGSQLSFHPSSQSGLFLFADRTGSIRIYDPYRARASNERPDSRDSASSSSAGQSRQGIVTASYLTPFYAQADSPAPTRRKRIISAEWVLGGRGILALLEDGQWGIWDLSGSMQTGKSLEDFTLQGYLAATTTAEIVDPGKPRKTSSKLAPMTPNTRKAKAENLFSGNAKLPDVASTGGISVTSNATRAGQLDESVIIWYNGVVYSIPSLQAFWQRSANSSGGFGSLYAPGLALVSDINLTHENITSISQFASSRSSTSNLGHMNTQCDLLISAEHRFIVLQNLRSQPRLFQQQIAERRASHDQRMLDVGELDLNDMNRMLDDLGEEGRVRQVSFAHQ